MENKAVNDDNNEDDDDDNNNNNNNNLQFFVFVSAHQPQRQFLK
jgi:hypothetical protein